MPYIESYVKENHRTIKSVNATLGYVVTLKAPIGEPRWSVTSQFTDIQNYIVGYSVLLNVDPGQVYSASEDGYF